jgi:hypothetical protein
MNAPDVIECSGHLLTVEGLTKAIKNSIDRKGMEETAARDMAKHIMNFFGYSDRIIDNVLEPEDRDAFYMLEDAGLLTTEREETTLYDGREWRIHYWLFRMDRISVLVEAEKEKDQCALPADASVYQEIPEEQWTRAAEEVPEESAPEKQP